MCARVTIPVHQNIQVHVASVDFDALEIKPIPERVAVGAGLYLPAARGYRNQVVVDASPAIGLLNDVIGLCGLWKFGGQNDAPSPFLYFHEPGLNGHKSG